MKRDPERADILQSLTIETFAKRIGESLRHARASGCNVGARIDRSEPARRTTGPRASAVLDSIPGTVGPGDATADLRTRPRSHGEFRGLHRAGRTGTRGAALRGDFYV